MVTVASTDALVQPFFQQKRPVLYVCAKPLERMQQEERKPLPPRPAIARVPAFASSVNSYCPQKEERHDSEPILLEAD